MFRRPPIPAEALADLDRRGVDAVRASLLHAAAGDKFGVPSQPHLQILYTLRETDSGTVSVTRADGERWLAWKAKREAAWVRVGTLAAIAAAILALGAWLFPVGH